MQHNTLTVEETAVAVKDKLKKTLTAIYKSSPSKSYPTKTDASAEIEDFVSFFQNRLLTELRGIAEHLISALENYEDNKPFRVLEIGCGGNFQLVALAEVIAEKLGKKIEYVGIDIDQCSIDSLAKLTTEHFTSAKFICHDASDIAWFQADIIAQKSFHAMIMMNPIVENPFKGAIDSRRARGMSEEDLEYFKYEVKFNVNFQRLYTQYASFKKIFREVLPVCLEPNAALLIRVFHPIEYKSLLKLAQPLVANELPSYEKARELHFCLTAQFNPARRQKLPEIKAMPGVKP